MKTLKYIFSCIAGILDAWVGKGTNNGIKEDVVGFGTMLVVFAVYFASLWLFDNRTTLSPVINVLCSIGVTILLICIVVVIVVVTEKMF